MGPTLRIKLRHWQVTNPYGSGENCPASAYEGPVEKLHEMPLAHAALVLVHCWNVGEEDGPYPLLGMRPDSTKHMHAQRLLAQLAWGDAQNGRLWLSCRRPV